MKLSLFLSFVALLIPSTLTPSNVAQERVHLVAKILELNPEFLRVVFLNTQEFGSKQALIDATANFLLTTKPDLLSNNPYFFVDIQKQVIDAVNSNEAKTAVTGGLAGILAKLKGVAIGTKAVIAKIAAFIALHPYVAIAAILVTTAGTVYYIYQSSLEATKANCLRGALNDAIEIGGKLLNTPDQPLTTAQELALAKQLLKLQSSQTCM